MIKEVTMTETIMFESDKQIIKKVELNKNERYKEIARRGFNTTAVMAHGKAFIDDRVIEPYTAVRLNAEKVNELFNEREELATFYIISTPAKSEDEQCVESYVRELKDCQILKPANGEFIWELEGIYNGPCKTHSVAIVLILPNHASARHYHPKEIEGMTGGKEEGIEETYIVISGKARLELGEEKPIELNPGDWKAIPMDVNHKIYSVGNKALEMIVTCARAWTPNCGKYVE